jgi:hypothetical protein
MGIDKAGNVMPVDDINAVPSFGAAADGDADRNVSSASVIIDSSRRVAY